MNKNLENAAYHCGKATALTNAIENTGLLTNLDIDPEMHNQAAYLFYELQEVIEDLAECLDSLIDDAEK